MSRKKPPLEQGERNSSQCHSQNIKDRLQETQHPRNLDDSTDLGIVEACIPIAPIITSPFPRLLSAYEADAAKNRKEYQRVDRSSVLCCIYIQALIVLANPAKPMRQMIALLMLFA